MENDVLEDALRVCNNILRSVTPEDKWVIVNTALNSRDTFLIPKCPAIPPVYGYRFESSPRFLERKGVIVAKTPFWWFVRITDLDSYYARQILPELELSDDIYWAAKEKNHLRKNQVIEYYVDETDTRGPVFHGQAAVLVNVKALIKFIGAYSEMRPRFDEATAIFSYRGEKIRITGDIEGKTIKLLVGNLGMIVGNKELYNVRSPANYDELIRSGRKMETHEMVEKTIVSLKKKIFSQKLMKRDLHFLQNKGHGLFMRSRRSG